MTYLRDRTICNSSCRCSRCDVQLNEAVRRAAAVWWDGQRSPVSPSIADRSAERLSFLPDGTA